nr:hypothetical protein [Neobacillus sp. Marseille-Q6967]
MERKIKMSFILVMKDIILGKKDQNVLHPGYEGQNSWKKHQNVLHPGYEGHNPWKERSKCPSSWL